MILRRMKHVAADLEFLKEVREEIAAMGDRWALAASVAELGAIGRDGSRPGKGSRR